MSSIVELWNVTRWVLEAIELLSNFIFVFGVYLQYMVKEAFLLGLNTRLPLQLVSKGLGNFLDQLDLEYRWCSQQGSMEIQGIDSSRCMSDLRDD